MLGIILIALAILPFLEVWLLYWVATQLGGWNTLYLVLATGFFGAMVAKYQGRQVLLSLRQDLQKGILPADSIFHGLLIFIGGLLLLVAPGFITDILGLLFVFPLTRLAFVGVIREQIQKAMAKGNIRVATFGQSPFQNHQQEWPREAYFTRPKIRDVEETKPADVIDIQAKRLERQTHDQPSV